MATACNMRDWLHVADHCAAIEAIIERGVAGEVYNVGGRAESTNIDLIHKLCAIADAAFARDARLRERFPRSPPASGRGSDSLITYVRDRPGHDRRYAIDCAKLEREIGFAVSRLVDDGLRDTFEWFVANEPWWRAVMDGSYQKWIDAQYATSR